MAIHPIDVEYFSLHQSIQINTQTDTDVPGVMLPVLKTTNAIVHEGKLPSPSLLLQDAADISICFGH